MNSFERHIAFLRNYDPTVRRMKKYFFFKNKFEELLKKINVDLVYFTGPSQYSLYLEKTDFIITIPDVSHREDLEFPEWTKSDTSEFHRREEIISKSSIKAIAVMGPKPGNIPMIVPKKQPIITIKMFLNDNAVVKPINIPSIIPLLQWILKKDPLNKFQELHEVNT